MIDGPGRFRRFTGRKGCRKTKNVGLEIYPVAFVMVGQGWLSQETSSGCSTDDRRGHGIHLQGGRQASSYVLLVSSECR